MCSVAGLAIYLASSMTGYLAGKGLSAVVIVCTLLAWVCLAPVELARLDGEQSVVASIRSLAAEVLLLVAFAVFVMSRVRLAADVYFIPVNYPPSEQTALNWSILGVAGYAVAIVAVIVRFCGEPRPLAISAGSGPKV
ncbi:MAG: hypothetical protein M3036_12835 [Bifidobacteriales bacterium]|nr:hypothetical protein [Bifidobacteriales bacterium]